MKLPDDNSQEVEDPKDQETSDWTDVDKLEKNHATPYSIEKLATNKVPHNIPYLEVYRTDELYYQPYTSPFLSSGVDGTTSVGEDGTVGADGSGGSGNGVGGGTLWTELANIVWEFYPRSTDKNYWIGELRSANTDWTSVAKVVNKMGGDAKKQNKVIQKVIDAKKKFPYDSTTGKMAKGMISMADKVNSSMKSVEKLRDELLKCVRKYYKSGIHHSVIVNQYIGAKNNTISLDARTFMFRKYLKSGVSRDTVNKEVLKIKKKYSK